ncbi:primosomal protein N' [Myxococcota bacterium]|nr:primosomal protein N' [Myxococcota bacterium]
MGPSATVEVAVALPLPGTFHYRADDPLAGHVRPGHALLVPFGPRRVTGYAVAVGGPPPEGVTLKPVLRLLLDEPVFPESMLAFYRFVSEYYHHPLGDVIRASLPAGVREETRRRVRLAEGAVPPGDDAEVRALLDHLRARGPTSAEALAGLGIPGPVLARASRGGLVVAEQHTTRAALAVRTERLYALTEPARVVRERFARPGPVRDRLIDYVGRFAPVPASTLGREFPGAARILKELEEKGLARVTEREACAHAGSPDAPLGSAPEDPPDLTPAQRHAVQEIASALAARDGRALLLYGVTGSGKTEVYLDAARRALEAGGGALVLVPEIALTPQLVGRFRARFREDLGVLHSGLTPRQRFEEWRKIREGRARIAIGARSAVFAPVRDLRLVVVDEEHDGSYKQDDGLRYSARDLALVRARREGAACVLGSATPSLESFRHAEAGRFTLLRLPDRPRGRPMPVTQVVDLRGVAKGGRDDPGRWIGAELRAALAEIREAGEQAILLLNRRGFATAVVCTTCGGSFRCTECDVALTYHGRRHALICHFCGLRRALPDRCPSCDGATLDLLGRGTERIEEELLKIFPGLRVDRMDQDTTRTRDAHREILERFASGQVDVLVGTQMISKGHDFPSVTLVGVLHADAALYLPDFRAAERTFQLLTQVSGRAGRGEKPGRVLVQAFNPHHYAIRHALAHDFEGFYRREARLREAMVYPPFGRMAVLRLEGPDERATEAAARRLGERLRDATRALTLDGSARGVRLLGPTPAPLYRLEGRYRWLLTLRAPDHRAVQALLRIADPAVRDEAKGGIRGAVDVDPQALM